jgi:hypothetical protein
VLGENPGKLEWVAPLLIAVGGGAALALAFGESLTRKATIASLLAAMGVLLLAPAAWAVDTLDHPTSGTFPAGGPLAASFGGGVAPPGAGGVPPGGALPGPGGGAGRPPQAGGFGGPGGGPFGGNTQSLTEALAYVRAHGGGSLAVSSQSGAASQLIRSGADVAGIGGFSGRESQVSVEWLADAVQDGRIGWVLTDGSGGGMFRHGRVGSSQVMAAVEQVGTPIQLSGSGGVLYDLHGHADDLRALAS